MVNSQSSSRATFSGQVAVLAGGAALRMRPLTENTPKALLPCDGRPFIHWLLERLRKCGMHRIVLCTGRFAEQIEESVGNGEQFDLEIQYSTDGNSPLGTGGALRNALPLLDETFIATYGDSYLPFDYAAPLKTLLSSNEALACMAVFRNQNAFDKSNCIVDGNLVTKYEKNSADIRCDYIDYGATALRRAAFEQCPEESAFGLDELQMQLARAQKLWAYSVEERFYEIGSLSGLKTFEGYLKSTTSIEARPE